MHSNMPKIFNLYKMPAYESGINVMRPSKFGNPYMISATMTRDQVCDAYENYVQNNPELIESIKKELKGHNLICCCGPRQRCHAMTLIRIANEEEVVF